MTKKHSSSFQKTYNNGETICVTGTQPNINRYNMLCLAEAEFGAESFCLCFGAGCHSCGKIFTFYIVVTAVCRFQGFTFVSGKLASSRHPPQPSHSDRPRRHLCCRRHLCPGFCHFLSAGIALVDLILALYFTLNCFNGSHLFLSLPLALNCLITFFPQNPVASSPSSSKPTDPAKNGEKV